MAVMNYMTAWKLLWKIQYLPDKGSSEQFNESHYYGQLNAIRHIKRK